MAERDLVVVTGEQVRGLLAGREQEVVDAVLGAYRAHARGQSSLPHSAFVHCPAPLGVLDLAVGKLVRDLALARGSHLTIPSFQPLADP